jgi:cell division protein FtsL
MTVMTQLRSRALAVGTVWSELLPALLLCGLFAGVGIVHVTSRVESVALGYTLSQLENEHRELVRENGRLRLELATLKSPARLERLARQRLSMAPPPAASIVMVSPPQTSAVGRSATALRNSAQGAPRVASRVVQEDAVP